MENKIKLIDCINAVKKFHNSFGISNEHSPTAIISENDYKLRHNLMKEENEEYLQAAKDGDLTEIADAVGDMLYILCGTILKHGLQIKFKKFLKKFRKVI